MRNPRKIIRKMGFLRDQEGIMSRYIREKSNWDHHLDKTKEFITSSFSNRAIETVAVLGSGWLLDVPLESLKTRFKHIYLVDIRHPPQIRKRIAAMDHVELVEADLSGGALGQCWQAVRKREGASVHTLLSDLILTPPIPTIHPHAFISVNLLNQLDIILCEFLEKHGYSQQEEVKQFRSVIQSFHLQWITKTPGCLITDTAEINIDSSGRDTLKPLLYTDLPQGARSSRWSWEFDTHNTYRPGTRTRMEVQAVEWV